MQYAVGQHIVHPKYGLGIVNRIETTDLLGGSSRCLKIHFPNHNTHIVVPIDKAAELNMRAPMGAVEVRTTLQELKRRARVLARLRPRERVKIYRPLLALGRPTDLAAVARDLGRLAQTKRLTDEETQMLEGAVRTLAKEMALAQDRDPQLVRTEIEGIIER